MKGTPSSWISYLRRHQFFLHASLPSLPSINELLPGKDEDGLDSILSDLARPLSAFYWLFWNATKISFSPTELKQGHQSLMGNSAVSSLPNFSLSSYQVFTWKVCHSSFPAQLCCHLHGAFTSVSHYSSKLFFPCFFRCNTAHEW